MKITKLILMFAAVALLSVGCSKDDDGGGDEKTTFSDNVPTGEIVPLEQRDEVLTGFANGKAKGPNGSQKWWKLKEWGMISKECPEVNSDENYSEEDIYFALYPNGKSYSKIGIDGTPDFNAYWEWASSAKDAIKLDFVDAKFYFTYLNEDNLVYASLQYGKDGTCSYEAYEQLYNPHFD